MCSYRFLSLRASVHTFLYFLDLLINISSFAAGWLKIYAFFFTALNNVRKIQANSFAITQLCKNAMPIKVVTY